MLYRDDEAIDARVIPEISRRVEKKRDGQSPFSSRPECSTVLAGFDASIRLR